MINRGIKLALVTALISGVAIFVNKFGADAVKPPLVYTAVKNSGVAVLILGWLIMSGKWRLFFCGGEETSPLHAREWFLLVLIGLIGGTLPFYLFFTGLAQISAINGALIHKTLVVWVALMTVPLLKERLTPLQILGVITLFAGNLVVGGFKGFQWSIGELMILGATILWAIENVLAKLVLPKVDADVVVMARMGIGSLLLLTVAVWQYPQSMGQLNQLRLDQWGWLAVGMTTLTLYVMTWYRALKLVPAVTVTAVLVSATLVTNILSAIFVTHTWNMLMGIQAGLIILGLGLFVWASRRVKLVQLAEE